MAVLGMISNVPLPSMVIEIPKEKLVPATAGTLKMSLCFNCGGCFFRVKKGSEESVTYRNTKRMIRVLEHLAFSW